MAVVFETHRGEELRNTEIEAWLARVGVRYEFVPYLSLGVIDRLRSLDNQARVGHPLSDDQALIYSEGYARGDVFPPLVAWGRRGQPLLVLADGNHRVAGCDLAGVEVHPAYVVHDPTDAQIIRLTYEANTKHGLPSTLQDRLYHAAHLVATLKLTQKDAAAIVRVPEGRLSKHINVTETRRRLKELGDRSELTDGKVDRLGRIKSNRVLAAAAPLSKNLTWEETDRLVTAINRARGEEQSLAIVAEQASLIEHEKKAAANLPPARRPTTPYRALTFIVNRASKLPTKEQVGSIPRDLQPQLRKRLIDLINKLDQVVEWLS